MEPLEAGSLIECVKDLQGRFNRPMPPLYSMQMRQERQPTDFHAQHEKY
jgi:hypothetical protein